MESALYKFYVLLLLLFKDGLTVDGSVQFLHVGWDGGDEDLDRCVRAADLAARLVGQHGQHFLGVSLFDALHDTVA